MRKTLLAFTIAAAFSCLMAGCTVTSSGGGLVTTGVYANYSQVALSVTNGTPTTICYLYLSPVSDPNWGPDQLGSRVLPSGQTETYQLYAGQWDIRADDCSHNQLAVLRNTTIASSSRLIIQ